MKILFVNPPNTTSLQVTRVGKYVEENIGKQFFPLPRIPFEVMASLSNIRDIDKDIILLDFKLYKNPQLSKEDLINLIARKNPDIILTTIIAQANADSIDWLTTKIREKMPKSTIILGGQAIRYFQAKIFKFCPNIDFALNGHLNNNLVDLIEYLKDKPNIDVLEQIDGLIYKTKQGVIKNKLPVSLKLLDFHPESLYSEYKDYISNVINFVKSKDAYTLGTIEFSKGCLFDCNFCAAKSTYIEKNISNVLKEIKYLYQLGIYRFYITDLTFGVNRKSRDKILDDLKRFKRLHSKFSFRCVTRADLINKKFINQLLEAGCYEVGVGIECHEAVILNLMNKNVSAGKNIESLRILGESGISFKLFLIEGYQGSNTLTSKRTFELLNFLEKKKYNYFIQPALSRDIIPSSSGFKEKEKAGILKRGTLNQLDFRHDCRESHWDTNKAIRSICFLMLAYPSTELGKDNRDKALQERTIQDIAFFKEGIRLDDVLNFVKELPTCRDKENMLSLRTDIIHFIDGVYTIDEIKDKIRKLHKDLDVNELNQEVDFCLSKLRSECLVDSFGYPNINQKTFKSNNNSGYINLRRKQDILLFWNGFDHRYLYAPLNKKVIKIKTCFYKNIPEEVFEFLILSKGIFSIDEVSEKMYKLFEGKRGFKSLTEAKETTGSIFRACKIYSLCY